MTTAEWRTETLGAIVEMASKKISVNELTVATYISTENMLPDRGGVESTQKLPRSGNVNSFQTGDVLFSNIRTYFKKVWHAPWHGGASADVIVFRPRNSEQLLSRFLYYILSSDAFIDSTVTASKGTKMPRGDKDAMKSYTLFIPPHLIQQRIAGILSAYDDMIENSQQRIKILESMARALYREWFVHFRYPGHESIPLVPSALGDIPQGWDIKKLATVAEVNRTQINSRSALRELHYIDISSVSPGQIDKFSTYDFADAPGRARRVVQHGDILWSCVRPNRRSHAQVMHPEINTIASTGFAVITATKVPFTFLYCAITTDDFVAYLSNNATGTAYPAVTAQTFEKADLLTPPAPLLSTFGEVTVPMAKEIRTLQLQIKNLRDSRDLLIPRLLSGQIDVLRQDEEGAA